MTRKDYILLARYLAETNPTLPACITSSVTEKIAAGQWRNDVFAIGCALARDNPRFDATAWNRATGLDRED